MQIEDNVDVSHYESKKVELESLRSMTNSRTVKEVITEAIERSDAAVKDLLATQQVVLLYLKAFNARSQKKLAQRKKEMDRLSVEITKVRNAPISSNDYIKVTVLSKASSALHNALGVDADLNEITLGVHTECAEVLSDTLLNHIFKHRKDFNADRIGDLFNYFTENKIPVLGELKLVMGMPTKTRQKKMVKGGDELLTYLEEYNDVLASWSHYCGEYMKLLLSDPTDLVMPD